MYMFIVSTVNESIGVGMTIAARVIRVIRVISRVINRVRSRGSRVIRAIGEAGYRSVALFDIQTNNRCVPTIHGR